MAGLFTHVGDDSLLVIETPPVEEFSGDHANFYAHNPVGGEQEIIDAYSWALVSESFALEASGYAVDLSVAVDSASASAVAAAASQVAAAASALAASTDADDASASAIAAGLSEDVASAAATAAGLSETAAAGSASAASSSASAASGSASAASASAAAALVSENNAEASELAAAASAAAAATFDPALYTSLAGTQTITGEKTFAGAGLTQVNLRKSSVGNLATLRYMNEAGFTRFAAGILGVADDDYFIGRYGETGVWADAPIIISGATGVANFASVPTVAGSALITSNTVQTITGWKIFEAAGGNTLLTVQKQADTGQAVLDFRDEAGVQRNIFGLAGGANDDFFIGRYNSSGVWQGSTMYVPAATGIADFQFTPTAGGVALALSNAVVNLTTDQTIAGVKTFSSATRCYRTAADMAEWWRTNATANQGRWLFQIGAAGEFYLLGLSDAGAAGDIAMQIARSGTGVPAVNLYAASVVTLATQPPYTGDSTTGAVVRHRNGAFYDVGVNGTPVLNLESDITLGPQHAGLLLRKWDTVARTITIPASSDVTIPLGARFEYAGWNPGTVTVTPGSGVTLSWLTGAGTSSGARTLAQGAHVTLVRADAGRWMIWGWGIS